MFSHSYCSCISQSDSKALDQAFSSWMSRRTLLLTPEGFPLVLFCLILYSAKSEKWNIILSIFFQFSTTGLQLVSFQKRQMCPCVAETPKSQFEMSMCVTHIDKMRFQSRERRECRKLFSPRRAVQGEPCVIHSSPGKFSCVCPYHHTSSPDWPYPRLPFAPDQGWYSASC